MKFAIILASLYAVNQAKVCNEVKECLDGQEWDDDACMCFTMRKCRMMCPEGEGLIPTEGCRCVPQCEIDSLYSDTDLCTDENRCGLGRKYYNKESGLCFFKGHCKKLCPEGEDLIPTEECRCVPQSEIDALYEPDSTREKREKEEEDEEESFAAKMMVSGIASILLIHSLF